MPRPVLCERKARNGARQLKPDHPRRRLAGSAVGFVFRRELQLPAVGGVLRDDKRERSFGELDEGAAIRFLGQQNFTGNFRGGSRGSPGGLALKYSPARLGQIDFWQRRGPASGQAGLERISDRKSTR